MKGKEITDVKQAIKYIEKKVNISVTDVSDLKYHLYDEDLNFYLCSDKELIDYANEQKEAIEDE